MHDKVFIQSNGRVNQEDYIEDLCIEKHITMAYNQDPGFFSIDNETNTINEDPPFNLGDS